MTPLLLKPFALLITPTLVTVMAPGTVSYVFPMVGLFVAVFSTHILRRRKMQRLSISMDVR